jgi:HPt (histidine-containing phosphotransfer) domain-containing protein
MIDRQKLNQNFQYFDKETIMEIIDIFFSEYTERVATMQKHINACDYGQLKFSAHSLKGVIANFQDPVTIDLSRKLDEKAKAQDPKGLQQLFEDLKSACEKLMEELRGLRAEVSAS